MKTLDAISAEREERRIQLRLLLVQHLAEGLGVVENKRIWMLGQTDVFVSPLNSDACYIADHLLSRHFGFSSMLQIADRFYVDGRDVTLVECTWLAEERFNAAAQAWAKREGYTGQREAWVRHRYDMRWRSETLHTEDDVEIRFAYTEYMAAILSEFDATIGAKR